MASKDEAKLYNEYGILQVLPCHKEDVRSVSSYPNGSVLTASRDKTAKLYQPEDTTNIHSELSEVQNFSGPTNFASSICYGKTKAGEVEIYVGSHDANIYVYTLMESKPITVMMRHADAVSALAFRVCNDQDVLVSGGWDSTTVLWRNKIPELTLLGHVHAIWSVAFVARSFILTGGADKTIRKWDVNDGQLLNIFEGHKDCVRGLAVINGQQFLSCSNDATAILWTMDGHILKTFEGHDNFIYSICVVREPLKPGADLPKNRPYNFVTVSEDKTVRVWDKEAGCIQKIPLQATTLWSVAALDNGNFVVGTSDGHAYVFSVTSPSPQANTDNEQKIDELFPSTSKSS